MPETKSYDFIINRRSGTVMRMGEDAVREELKTAFGDKAGEITFIDGKDIESSVAGWIKKNAGSDRGIIIGGGDGTVLTAAETAMGKEGVTLGVLPMGTQNLFARRLGFSADFTKAAKQYQDSEAALVDVASVNGQNFLVALAIDKSNVNFFEARELWRDGKKWPAMKKAFAAVAGRKEKMVVKADREIAEYSGKIIAVTSNPFQPRSNKGQMWKVFQGRKIKDISANMLAQPKEAAGKLGFYAVKLPVYRAFSLIEGIHLGTWQQNGSTTAIAAKELTIMPVNDNVPMERSIILDGEIKKTRFPMQVKIAPGALKVYRPK